MENKKRGISAVKILLSMFVLVGIMHLSAHVAFYGTGIPEVYEKGLSGFSIKGISGNELKAIYPNISPVSLIILSAEWLLVFMIISFLVINRKIEYKKEIAELNIKKIQRGHNKTDLDVLYELLKDKKSLKVTTISKIFDVEKDTVMEWGEILESGNFATLEYPRMGEPEIKLKS